MQQNFKFHPWLRLGLIVSNSLLLTTTSLNYCQHKKTGFTIDLFLHLFIGCCFAYLIARTLFYKNYIVVSANSILIRDSFWTKTIMLDEISNLTLVKNKENEIRKVRLVLKNGKQARILKGNMLEKDLFSFIDHLAGIGIPIKYAIKKSHLLL